MIQSNTKASTDSTNVETSWVQPSMSHCVNLAVILHVDRSYRDIDCGRGAFAAPLRRNTVHPYRRVSRDMTVFIS